MRVMAIDWSGRATGAEKHIWVAEVADGRLTRLENGRDRAGIAAFLIEEARRDSSIVVGLDFAFSLPAWYLDHLGLRDARQLWRLAAERAEDWLHGCETPFWGRPGKTRPNLPAHFRRTEQMVPATANNRPKSVFQIGGAGTVGTGSLRGMALLDQMAAAGFAIWPFDQPNLPLIVEIYPRLLTGEVVKSNPAARDEYLRTRAPEMGAALVKDVSESDDAFDAAISALAMWRHRTDLTSLRQGADDIDRREGAIWYPAA